MRRKAGRIRRSLRRAAALVCVGVAVCALLVPVSARADGYVDSAGHLWAKIGYSEWRADETFAGPRAVNSRRNVELGDRVPFDTTTGGALTVRSLELEASYVPVPKLVAGAYMPVIQSLTFRNRNFVRESVGTGDVRPYLGYQLTPPDGNAATTVFVRGKIPLTDIDTGFLALPLSEGQFDLAVEQVTTWRPIPAFQLTGVTMFRYRFAGRFPDSGASYKPGNEMVVRMVVGGRPVESLWLEGAVEGMWSTGWENREAPGPSRDTYRAYQRARFGAYWKFGRWLGSPFRAMALDVSGTIPFAGRDYPAGPTWTVGLAWSRDLRR